jgi:propanol-preferring alcohol dehydrogenase
VELEEPRPGEGEVLVRVEACGIGLTVLNCIRGDLGADPAHLPRVPGHELVGVVEEVGPGVDPGRVGERVGAYFYLSCGRCRRCLAGFEPLCERLGGNVGVARDGGYAERCVLPAFNALALGEELDPVLATTVPDAVSTPVHVARRAPIRPGERVAVVAAGGGVGIHMVQVARACGAEVAGLEAVAAKLDFLERELGIGAVDSSDFSRASLPSAWGGRADVIVDLLGSPESLAWSAARLEPNGRLVCLTTFRDVDLRVSPRELVLAQTSVVGSRYASRAEVAEAARLVAAGAVRPVVGRRVGLDGLESVHEELRRGTLLGRGRNGLSGSLGDQNACWPRPGGARVGSGC